MKTNNKIIVRVISFIAAVLIALTMVVMLAGCELDDTSSGSYQDAANIS